jgi:putative transposase
VGDVEIIKPRLHDRRAGEEHEVFHSKILPPYMRRAKAIEELIPWLYLKGISTGGFSEALQSLLGPNAAGLSATTVTRLVQAWQAEFADWSTRSLADNKEYVYVWADGIYFNVRLEDEANAKQCILVMMGATADGKKELIAVLDGFRESEQAWKELLQDVKRRGLAADPKVACADGALGFWAAARKVWPATREQRCWVHKTANVLVKMPKSMQSKAKARLHDIWQAETRAAAEQAFDGFVADFGAKYENAVRCLTKDRDVLLTFYDCPAEHWRHLRTTNPIESTFATVRLRHRRTKGNGSRAACLAMVFKLAQSAEKHWRRLNGHQLIADVIRGVRFIDGIKHKVAA